MTCRGERNRILAVTVGEVTRLVNFGAVVSACGVCRASVIVAAIIFTIRWRMSRRCWLIPRRALLGERR